MALTSSVFALLLLTLTEECSWPVISLTSFISPMHSFPSTYTRFICMHACVKKNSHKHSSLPHPLICFLSNAILPSLPIIQSSSVVFACLFFTCFHPRLPLHQILYLSKPSSYPPFHNLCLHGALESCFLVKYSFLGVEFIRGSLKRHLAINTLPFLPPVIPTGLTEKTFFVE